MKTIHEMTHQEIIALTDEQVERYIDLECAKAGVPLLPPEPTAPDPFVKNKDVEVWAVGGFHFTDRIDAENVVAAINVARSRVELSYETGSYADRLVEPAEQPVSTNAERHYSRAQWQREKDVATKARRAQEQHERDMKDYRELVQRRKEIAREIRETVDEAYTREYRRQFLRGEFDRYLRLAENDKRVALRFLSNTYDDARDVLDDENWALLDAQAAVPAEAELASV